MAGELGAVSSGCGPMGDAVLRQLLLCYHTCGHTVGDSTFSEESSQHPTSQVQRPSQPRLFAPPMRKACALALCIAVAALETALHSASATAAPPPPPVTVVSWAQLTAACGKHTTNAAAVDIVLAPGFSCGDFDQSIKLGASTAAVTVHGNGHVLDAQGRDQFFDVEDGASLTLKNLTLRNGSSLGSGGAIYCQQSTVRIESSVLERNAGVAIAAGAGSDEGGSEGSSSSSSNSSSSRARDSNSWLHKFCGGCSSATFQSCDTYGQRCADGSICNDCGYGAGAVYSIGCALTVESSTLAENTANFGGGVTALRGSTVRILASALHGNTGSGAGAIYSAESSLFVDAASVVSNNSAPQILKRGNGTRGS